MSILICFLWWYMVYLIFIKILTLVPLSDNMNKVSDVFWGVFTALYEVFIN